MTSIKSYRRGQSVNMFQLLALMINCLVLAPPTAAIYKTWTNCTFFGEDDACYGFETQLKSWDNARQYCTSKGGHLANVTTPETQRFLEINIPVLIPYWIGARKQKIWTWENGRPVAYSNWQTGHPLDNPGELCAQMKYTNGVPEVGQIKWSEDNCSLQKAFICQYDLCCGEPPQKGQNSYRISHTDQTIGCEITFSCDGGYSLAENSSLTVRCLGNGEWSSPPICLPTTTSMESVTEITTNVQHKTSSRAGKHPTSSASGNLVIKVEGLTEETNNKAIIDESKPCKGGTIPKEENVKQKPKSGSIIITILINP